jgi:outer membrane beta-barrel protein
MTQARRWLLIAAAIVLLPTAALAQPKKGGGKGATKPPSAAAPAAAAGGAIDLDDPNAVAPPPAAPVELGQPAAPAAPAAAGVPPGGICDIDPSACPKEADIKEDAKKVVKAEVWAVEQIYALRLHRLELQPYWSFSLNDQFVSHPGPGLAANFYVTNVLAVGVNGTYYGAFNSDSDFNFENRRATRIAVPLNEYQWTGNFNFTYVPVYGKFAGFGNFIFSYDSYVVGGVGAISTRPIPVIDPDNRTFQYKPKLDVNVGIGLRIFLNRWFAFNLEVRDYIYDETLESLTIANNPTDQTTWTDKHDHITNDVQAQIGLSVFLPFSFEYHRPK